MGAKTSGNFWHIILGHGHCGGVGAQRIEIITVINVIIIIIIIIILVFIIIGYSSLIRRATRPRAVLDVVPSSLRLRS